MLNTRALRFEVTFPGWRSVDLLGKTEKDRASERGTEQESDPKPKKSKSKKPTRGGSGGGGPRRKALWKRLWQMSDDLTRASNRLISALWQVQIGTMPQPLNEKGEPIFLRTLAYQGLSGKWIGPDGKPFYRPEEDRAGSSVLLDVASTLHTRLQTDFEDIRRGKKALSTFRSMPIGVASAGVHVSGNGDVTLTVFAGKEQNRITVAQLRLDDGSREILTKIGAGVYKCGSAKLAWAKPEGRKGKWMLSLSWTGDVARATGDLIAGVDIGMRTTATVVYISKETGKATHTTDLVRLPSNVVRGWRRLEAERRERGGSNRAGFMLRSGKGRQRKIRVFDALSDKHARLTNEGVRQVAASIVQQAKKRGATAIAIEALTGWSVAHALDELPDATNAQRADRRKWYFRWHQGALRQAIKDVGPREGLDVIEVEARNSSRTCAACGAVYPDVYPGMPKRDPAPERGYLRWDLFRCTCPSRDRHGKIVPYSAHGERNAGLVLAQRGREELAKRAAAK